MNAQNDTLHAIVIGAPLPHESAVLHVTGEARYTDDIPELAGTLHAAIGTSSRAHATIRSLDLSAVKACPGVRAVITADDVPGINDMGSVLHSRSSQWRPIRWISPVAR